MKKLILSLCIMLSAFCTIQAQDYKMRAAIEKFVNDPKLASVNKITRNGVDNVNGETRRWACTQYVFSIRKSHSDIFQSTIMKAYEKDRRDKRTTTFLKTEPTRVQHTFRFSTMNLPVTIGNMNQERSQIIICGDEKSGQNTVFAIEMWGDETISGNIYIIERHPSFLEMAAEQEATKNAQGNFDEDGRSLYEDVIDDDDEDLRRLYFYAKKYEEEAKNGGGSAIVRATVLVVSDIIQNATEWDLTLAKQIIDRMIMATPDPNSFTLTAKKETLQENANTLLNLLSRLDSKTEYSSMQSTPKTFRINGMIDEELWDIGYYVSMSNETMGDPTHNPELVKAEGQAFHYQTELDNIRLGRVRALMKDGTICSAWIELLFVPGETAELTVHNGSYSLSGTGFYKDWNEADRAFRNAGPWNKFGDTAKCPVFNLLKNNTDKPAYFVFAFKENLIPSREVRKKAYDLLPKETKESPYGVFLRKYL